jgi:hypothetical protein
MATWPAYGGNFTRDMAHAVGVIVEEWNELERSLEALLLTYLDSNLILGHIVTNEMGMRAFCADLTLCPRGHSYVENDEWIRVFCFAEKAHAEKFQASSEVSGSTLGDDGGDRAGRNSSHPRGSFMT